MAYDDGKVAACERDLYLLYYPIINVSGLLTITIYVSQFLISNSPYFFLLPYPSRCLEVEVVHEGIVPGLYNGMCPSIYLKIKNVKEEIKLILGDFDFHEGIEGLDLVLIWVIVVVAKLNS